jgi:hypothetical protein
MAVGSTLMDGNYGSTITGPGIAAMKDEVPENNREMKRIVIVHGPTAVNMPGILFWVKTQANIPTITAQILQTHPVLNDFTLEGLRERVTNRSREGNKKREVVADRYVDLGVINVTSPPTYHEGYILIQLQVKNTHQSEWEREYDELILYKEKHGETRVPQHYKHNKSLGKVRFFFFY